MNEVPLDRAELLWSDGPDGFAVVVDHESPVDRFRNLDNSRGACDAGWSRLTTPQQILTLMSVAWSAVIRDQVPAGVMHRALIAIPEYRSWIANDTPGVSDWPDSGKPA